MEPLAAREIEVLTYAANGRSNKEMAADMELATGTVNAYLKSAYRKLGARERAQAVALCLKRRIIPMSAVRNPTGPRPARSRGRKRTE